MAPVKREMRPLQRTFLKEWREHAKLDQEGAATLLNVSRALLSKIENAKSPYSQRILEHAAEIYKCSPADILAVDPSDKNSLWLLWERAEQTSGTQRIQIRKLIKVGLGDET